MTRLLKTAHDPGDSQITSHCPFCGSGQVIGRSDGNIECEFCGMTYLVRIQPMFTGMPQNPMGGAFGGPSSVATDLMSPGMVGPDGMPLDPGMADPMLAEEEAQGGQPFGDEEDVPPGEEVLEGGMPSGPAETEGTGEDFPPGMEGEEELPPGEAGDDEGGGGPDEDDGESGDGPPWARGKSSPKNDDGSSGGKSDKKPSKGKGKDQKKPPPFKKKSVRYRTIAGDLLPEDAYIRHLACLHGGVEVLRRPA